MTKQLRHKKLHTLVRDAVRDLVKVSKDKRYSFEMGDWHAPNGHCAVCVAGAVIAKSLNCSSRKYLDPSHFDEGTATRLRALDTIRTGDIGRALDFELGLPHTYPQVRVLKAAWHESMRSPEMAGEDAFIKAWRSFARKAREVGI